MAITRRQFVKGAVTTVAAVGVPLSTAARVRGANGDIRAAVIGFRGRGMGHINDLSTMKGVRLVALCDVDGAVRNKVVAKFTAKGKCDSYDDVRRLLNDKDIDAISTATPNHWHSLIAIWGVQAGKDVYVEKPVSHNVWEGRQAVNAARKHNKIILTGTQSRSASALHEAQQWIASGGLGKIKYVVGTCYKRRPAIGKRTSPLEIPANVNYELWCGPAEKRDIFRDKLHYDWHWDFNTGNGDLGNQGIHQMDIARWFLGVNELSPRVMSLGGRLGYEDAGNTPNTQIVYHDYDKAPLIFEVRGLPASANPPADAKDKSQVMGAYRGSTIGVVVQCENGHLIIPSYSSCTAYDQGGKVVKEFKGGGSHFQTFIDAVRSRKLDPSYGDILEGHLSSALCHTGNISYQLGQKMPTGQIREQIKSSHEASESFGRLMEHLKANNIAPDTQLTLGPWLKMDPKTERFVGNETADKLLTRAYRKGFEVPAISA